MDSHKTPAAGSLSASHPSAVERAAPTPQYFGARRRLYNDRRQILAGQAAALLLDGGAPLGVSQLLARLARLNVYLPAQTPSGRLRQLRRALEGPEAIAYGVRLTTMPENLVHQGSGRVDTTWFRVDPALICEPVPEELMRRVLSQRRVDQPQLFGGA